MVAGVKGVAFLDGDTMAVTSSTKGELFLVSKASQSVLRRVELDVKAESLCAVPGTRRVLVAEWRCCSAAEDTRPPLFRAADSAAGFARALDIIGERRMQHTDELVAKILARDRPPSAPRSR